MTDRSQIEEIKDRLDIVNIVREYVPNLKHAGRNYFGLCPFHSEKTPSFSVNEEIKRYKCFGCGEAGDVINFIEKVEGIDFPRALEIAAEKAGVKLKKEFVKEDKAYQEKKDLYELNRVVSEFFHYILTKHEKGQRGLGYARKRNLSDSTISLFKIGYAPKSFDSLRKYLEKKGYKDSDLVKWSLLVEKNGRIYDKFRDRLMFPIFNHLGDIIGFSGRVIDNNDIPKYLNSSETVVYKKSDVLYGLYQCKDDIRRSRKVIIVEGNVDVPTAFQNEIHTIVAPMGTALTEHQLTLLKRYADIILFSFDSDSAGEKALVRSFALAEKVGFESKAIDMGSYKDLDEYLNKDKDNAMKAIENAENVVEHLIKRRYRNTDLSEAPAKSKFISSIIPFLKFIKDEVQVAHYIQELANYINVKEEMVWEKYRKTSSSDDREDNAQDFGTSAGQAQEIDFMEVEKLYIEEEMVAFLVQYEFLRGGEDFSDMFENSKLKEIYKVLNNSENTKAFLAALADEHSAQVSDLTMRKLGEFESETEIKQYFDKLISRQKKLLLKKELDKVNSQIRRAEASGDDFGDLLLRQKELMVGLK